MNARFMNIFNAEVTLISIFSHFPPQRSIFKRIEHTSVLSKKRVAVWGTRKGSVNTDLILYHSKWVNSGDDKRETRVMNNSVHT